MNDDFHPPIKKSDNAEPFQRVFEMMNQFFDESPLKKMLETLDQYFVETLTKTYIPIHIQDTKHEHIISVDLPNVKRNQIHLEVADHDLILTINNSETIETIDEQTKAYQKRHAQQNIVRMIPLPYPVSEKDIKASFQNGQLIIRLPQKRKYIDIE